MMIAGLALLIITVYYTFHRLVGRRLAAIAKHFKNTASLDDKTGLKPLDCQSNDEIGELAKTFNQMIDDLSRTTTSIDNLNIEIAERKRTEEKLKLTQFAVDNASDMSFWISEDAKFVYVNNMACKVLGYSRQELLSMAVYDIDPEFPKEKWAEHWELLKKEQFVMLESAHRNKNGQVYPVEISSGYFNYGGKGYICASVRDITERKQVKDALERRVVALTKPLDDSGEIAFEDLFNIDDIQRLQDEFADATGVASIITHTNGKPLTRPSNFCRLCSDIIRKTKKGRENCSRSDAALGRLNPDGPIIQPCMSGGLWDAGAAISVEGKHVANWLIGQVRDETQTEEKMREYARQIGADEEDFVEAFYEVPTMSQERFRQIAQVLFTLADQLSTSAYQNMQQARFITEHKQVEEALSAEAARRRILMEQSRDGIVVLGRDGGVYESNRRFAEMLGYPPEEVCKLNVWDWEYQFTREQTLEMIRTVDEKGDNFETKHRRKDGTIYDVEISTNAAVFEEEKMIFCVCRDITERKQAEQVLQKAKETALSMMENAEIAKKTADQEKAKLSAMISGMKEGVVFADAENRIVEVNEYFCQFTNTPREKIIGKKIEDIHKGEPLEHVTKLIEKFRQNSNSEPFIMQRPLGKAEIILRVQPIYADNLYQGVLLNVIDVTDLVEARIQAEKAQKDAESSSKAKSHFLANMSHEIRTPMNAIIGYSDLLTEEGLTDEQNNYVNIICNSGRHLLQVIDDILDFSKIEAGKLNIEKQDCSLKDLLVVIDSMIAPLTAEKNLEFEIQKTPGLPANINTDMARLQQCLINLVNNAIKFTKEGYVHLNVSLQDKNDQPYIRFDVEDTGIGIPQERQNAIFESFTQADGSTSRKYGGTGLGLTITKQLTELLGGELTLTSQEGAGSTFSIVIPTGLDVKTQPLLDRCSIEDHTKITKERSDQPEFSGHV
ncbi:MAG: PAS domain S-box protein, partial [Sedimentisphaerales bacterium]|nr:PAS domain S-box protein [Sedimentisphaerales bacterium]